MGYGTDITRRWGIFNYKTITMFGLFKKKTEIEKLDIQYKKALSEAHQLASTNRKLSDEKMAEANDIGEKIEKLRSI